jgi:hypothetical protein
MNEETEVVNIDSLPAELILRIAEHLDPQGILILILVAKKYYQICELVKLQPYAKNVIMPEDRVITGIIRARTLAWRDNQTAKKIAYTQKSQFWPFTSSNKEVYPHTLSYTISLDDAMTLPTLFPYIFTLNDRKRLKDLQDNLLGEANLDVTLLHEEVTPKDIGLMLTELLPFILRARAYDCFTLVCRFLFKVFTLNLNEVHAKYFYKTIRELEIVLNEAKGGAYFLQQLYYHSIIISELFFTMNIIGEVSETTLEKIMNEHPKKWDNLYENLHSFKKNIDLKGTSTLQKMHYVTLIKCKKSNLLAKALTEASNETLYRVQEHDQERWLRNIDRYKTQAEGISRLLTETLSLPITEKSVQLALSLHGELNISLQIISRLMDNELKEELISSTLPYSI